MLLAGLALPWLAQGAEVNAVLQRDQPIYIESDSLKIDDLKGVSTYQGNVLFRQGSATLHADALVIHSRDRKEVERIVASGKPARFEQKAEDGGREALGEARRIEYVAPRSLVILDGDASFRQGDNEFAGNRIEYEVEQRVVRAGKAATPGGQEGRVKIVIQPRSADASNDQGEKP